MGSRSLPRGGRLLDSVSSRVLKLSSSVAILVDNRLRSGVFGRARPSLLGAFGHSRGSGVSGVSGVSVFRLGPHPSLVVILSGLPLNPLAISDLSGAARVSRVSRLPRIAARLPAWVHWASRVSSNRPHLLSLDRCACVVFRIRAAAEAGSRVISLGVCVFSVAAGLAGVGSLRTSRRLRSGVLRSGVSSSALNANGAADVLVNVLHVAYHRLLKHDV